MCVREVLYSMDTSIIISEAGEIGSGLLVQLDLVTLHSTSMPYSLRTSTELSLSYN